MNLLITLEWMLCAKPENNWYFFRAVHEHNDTRMTVICKGSMGWTPNEKETLSLTGDWVIYKGERQFQFKAARLTLPLEPRSQLHYVCERTRGIGPALEQSIWDAKKENWRDLEFGEIEKMSRTIFELFGEQVKIFDSNSEKAEICAWLEDKGCTQKMASDAYEKWGGDTAGIVNENCYCLANLEGYSFRTVDENIRRNFDIADDDPRRVKSGILYALDQARSDGSTAVDCWNHITETMKLLPGIGKEEIISYVKDMDESGKLHVFREHNTICMDYDFIHESTINAFDIDKEEFGIDIPSADILAEGEKFTPDESQIEAVRYAIDHRFAIINGGAGVGKTTVIKMIVRGIRKSRGSGWTVRLCAPTGKAAARLKEASGINATTIHSMLMAQENNKFAAGDLGDSTVIVDESSMVDSMLMAEIMKRNPRQLILVGDQAQLTPVGNGQPFHDLITIRPEAVHTLTKCYRNKEAVFQAATQIRNGNLPPRSAASDNEKWTIVPDLNESQVQKQILDYAENDIIDFDRDIILCPKNGKNEGEKFPDATVNSMNEELLAISRRKNGHGTDSGKFIPGDRVINTKNYPEEEVWNGTTGTVHSVDDDGKGMHIELDIPTSQGKKFVHFDSEMMKSLQYAYALTIHKSQGSQYRNVYIVILARDKFQLDRSLIYTAVTRTRQECVILGNYSAFEAGINIQKHKRTVLQCLNGVTA